MSRTRMQAAVPAPASVRVSPWKRLVQAQHDHLPLLRNEIAKVQIGGAIVSAIYRTELGTGSRNWWPDSSVWGCPRSGTRDPSNMVSLRH